MASINELKQRIDIHDLAEKLGMERPGGTGNYKSPHHKDQSPSVSIFNDGKAWKDHSEQDAGGSCIDLIMWIDGIDDVGQAAKRLHEIYGIPSDIPKNEPHREKTLVEHIVGKCFHPDGLDKTKQYLIEGRGISKDVVNDAIKRKTVGFNAWNSDNRSPYEPGYGGPSVAFITYDPITGHAVAVESRYIDSKLNGGVKTQCQGEKKGYLWTSSRIRVKNSPLIYMVESAINAMSIESCNLSGSAVVATRGTSNIKNIDLHFLSGKKVVLVMDNDEPNERTGYCPGAQAAWEIYDRLTALNIPAHIVDQKDWVHNDVNDILKNEGVSQLSVLLRKLEPWAIQGRWGCDGQKGKSRIFLPSHDVAQYWRYQVKEDFTRFIGKRKETDDGIQDEIVDLAGFRIASLTRITIASATSTMSGEKDAQPKVLFAASVQTPRHKIKLIRRVFDDDKLHNVDQWKKFGSIYIVSAFLRLLDIWGRGADLGARNAVNFVGLAWRDGKLIVNEGPDCYFTEPEKQCPYHNLVFPSGTKDQARQVIRAYQSTFTNNSALLPLVWSLGAHLKAHLGFWPHMVMQADKGSGKTTLLLRLTRTLAFTLFSNESLKTAYRILTSISHTSHPVGWEEISANSQKTINEAVSMLQQCYQYTVTKRGPDMTEYLQSAPVLLAGEDVPVKSLTGKLVRTDLSGKMGPMMPESLPKFPVREWLQYLANLSREQVHGIYENAMEYCRETSRASGEEKTKKELVNDLMNSKGLSKKEAQLAVENDTSVKRMEGNYAAMLTAWRLLCDFADIHREQGNFITDCVAEMNSHIADTSGDREPWVWILEKLLNEIASNTYRMPFAWSMVNNEIGEKEECLIIRVTQIMHHLSSSMALRDFWNSVPVKSDRVLKRQLEKAGVLADKSVERTINGRRECHMVAISLERLKRFGLHAAPPEQLND